MVDPNLFHEHVSRYRFATRMTAGKRVLDAGCGSGYGTAQFANAAHVTGIDCSFDAVLHAREHFGNASVQFAQARCETLPFSENSFDIVTAFEVIEHLQDWQSFLFESQRVLRDGGVLFVSTPNKAYYAESRAEAGPNPFHVHEFEFEEFRTCLLRAFPQVQIWFQNHAESMAFTLEEAGCGGLEVGSVSKAQDAHFYLAVCSGQTLPQASPFAWLPDGANALREREKHIQLLQREVAQKTDWLKDLENRHAKLREEHEAVNAELRRSNRWAEGVRAELEKAREVVAVRDSALIERDAWIESLQRSTESFEQDIVRWQESQQRLEGELIALQSGYQAREKELSSEIDGLHAGYARRISELEGEMASVHSGYRTVITNLGCESEVLKAAVKSTQHDLAATSSKLTACGNLLALVSESKWLKLGRAVGLGPKLDSTNNAR